MEKQETETMLIHAAMDGNLRLLRKMARRLDAGQGEAAVVAAARLEGCGPLHHAAVAGKVAVCRYLVEDLRLDVNAIGDQGETPLMLAALFGMIDAARYLLDHGSNPDIASQMGSPLLLAAGEGHCDVVELLLSRGASVDLLCQAGAALHVTASRGQDGAMKILLDHHADPNKLGTMDTIPLNLAISAKSLKCVKLLIKAGADVNFVEPENVTPVMIAASEGLTDITKCLLEAGANPNTPDEFGRIPIEVAAHQGGRDIVEVLFPFSTPIPAIPDWSIDGIISHVKSHGLKKRDKILCEKKRDALKLKATEAFNRKDYMEAVMLYGAAISVGPSDADAALLANRSLCWLRLDGGHEALSDANMCRAKRPFWPKACYRQGAALMLLKSYDLACEAFSDGLKLDPTNVEIENALREAKEAMKRAPPA